MAEGRTLDDTVKAAMSGVSFLGSFVRDYNEILKEKDYDTLGQSKLIAEQIIFAGRDLERDPNAQRELKELREEWDCQPENLRIKLGEAYSEQVKRFKDIYEANRDLIYQDVESILNNSLEGLDPSNPYSKREAADLLAIYLGEVLKKELSDEEAQGILRADFSRNTGTKYLTKPTTGSGSKGAAQGSYASQKAADYITEEKDRDGKAIGYKVDSKKLKKFTEKIESGSVLYSTVIATNKALKEAKKRA